MKSIVKIVKIILSAWLILCMNACVSDIPSDIPSDNPSENPSDIPSSSDNRAQFFGSIIDEDMFEPIQQDMFNGSCIDFVEQSSKDPNTQQIFFHTDGTFRDSCFFPGTYIMQALRGNFFPTEKEIIEIKRKKEHYFVSRPYIRIHILDISFDDVEGKVTAEFTLEQISENPIASIHLMADENPDVSYYMARVMTSAKVNAVVPSERRFQLKMSTKELVSGNDYYFRIAALIADIPEAKHNYSVPVKLTIDNSKVIFQPEYPSRVLDDCETNAGWTCVGGGNGILDSYDKKEGFFSVRFNINGTGMFAFMKGYEPFDTEVTRQNGYLAFDFFISDTEMFGKSMRLDLTSSMNPDGQRLGFEVPITGLGLKSGWNKVELNLTGPPMVHVDWNGGPCDLTAINYFRIIVIAPTGPLTVKIDHIRFYKKS